MPNFHKGDIVTWNSKISWFLITDVDTDEYTAIRLAEVRPNLQLGPIGGPADRGIEPRSFSHYSIDGNGTRYGGDRPGPGLVDDLRLQVSQQDEYARVLLTSARNDREEHRQDIYLIDRRLSQLNRDVVTVAAWRDRLNRTLNHRFSRRSLVDPFDDGSASSTTTATVGDVF